LPLIGKITMSDQATPEPEDLEERLRRADNPFSPFEGCAKWGCVILLGTLAAGALALAFFYAWCRVAN
jgi:hypothetical protein